VQATGDSELAETMAKEKTLYNMLKSFQTGTWKSNEWKRARALPTPDKIPPITEINFDSPEHKAKVALHKASAKPSIDLSEPTEFVPDHVTVQATCNAAEISPSKIPYMGYQLLSHRHENLQENVDAQAEKLRSVQQGSIIFCVGNLT
jgi:hypothetical protein